MKKDNIIAVFVGIAVVGHIVGYFFWENIRSFNIYYVSFYFMMTNTGLALMLTLNGRLAQYVTMAMFSLGGGFLYMEFAGNPQKWTNVNILCFTFIGVNSLLISRWIEKQKQK